MKKKISVTLFFIGIFLISFSFVQSFFHKKGFLRGIQLRIADFVPPFEVVLTNETIYTNKDNYRFDWEDSSDYQKPLDSIYYRFWINEIEYRTDISNFILDISGYADGDYEYKVRSCDYLNNCSKWSKQQLLVIDRQTPEVNILVGDFIVREANFNQYSANGDIETVVDYVQIGNNLSKNYWNQNNINYIVSNSPRLRYLSFEYQTSSVEDLSGFDQTKLVVTVNDDILFFNNEVSESDQWKKVVLDLFNYENKNLKISFFSGNSGDNQYSSWAKIRNITTDFILRKEVDNVNIQSSNHNEEVTFTLESNNEILTISASDLTQNNTKIEKNIINDLAESSTKESNKLSLLELGIINSF